MKFFPFLFKKKPEQPFIGTGTVGNGLPIYPPCVKIGVLSIGSIQENNINQIPQIQGKTNLGI